MGLSYENTKAIMKPKGLTKEVLPKRAENSVHKKEINLLLNLLIFCNK